MDVEIVKKDGSKYRLSDYGVVYDFVVNSITIENYTERIEGRSGLVDYGADYGVRRIKIPMKFKNFDLHDYAHLRDEVYGILTDTESYYIREMRRPRRLEYEFVDFGQAPKYKAQTDNNYVDGKQYLVRMKNELEPEQLYDGGEIEIEFETTELPFAKTIYTTLDLSNRDFVDSAEMFGLTDGINDEMRRYSHTTNTFSIWNGGNVEVTPEEFPLEITFLGASSSGNATVTNLTTGDKFIYKDAITNKKLTIDGVHVLVEKTNRTRNSNRNFLSLVPGENVISIKNLNFNSVNINFNFYYK